MFLRSAGSGFGFVTDRPPSSRDLPRMILDGRASTRCSSQGSAPVAAASPRRSRQEYRSTSRGCRAGTRKMWPRGATSSSPARLCSTRRSSRPRRPSTCETSFIQHLSALFRATRGRPLGLVPGVRPLRFKDMGRARPAPGRHGPARDVTSRTTGVTVRDVTRRCDHRLAWPLTQSLSTLQPESLQLR